jgi:uncharacterized membrane protein
MDDNALDDLVRRLTALVGKLDQTSDQLLLMAEQQQEFNREQHEFNREQREFNREQREFNREQLRINARLETLMTEVFRQRTNGQDA